MISLTARDYFITAEIITAEENLFHGKYGLKTNWQDQLRKVPGMPPELQDPSGFGFTFLYRTPPPGADPNEADPTHFSIYSDEAEKFDGKNVDFESFGLRAFSLSQLYDFIKTDHRVSNNGKLYCWYTSSFGPYTLVPGDSVGIILAEVAGTLDLHEVYKGDPDHWLKSFNEGQSAYMNDSLAADMQRNVDAVRNAVKWGLGARVDGIDLAADVPDSPPAPDCQAINASYGGDTAIIAVRWGKFAEEAEYRMVPGKYSMTALPTLTDTEFTLMLIKEVYGTWLLIFRVVSSASIEMLNLANIITDYTVQFGFEYYYYVEITMKIRNSGLQPMELWLMICPNLQAETTTYSSKPETRTCRRSERRLDVFVAPNPYIDGDPDHSFPIPYKIEFRKLPEKATIHIYSLSGIW